MPGLSKNKLSTRAVTPAVKKLFMIHRPSSTRVSRSGVAVLPVELAEAVEISQPLPLATVAAAVDQQVVCLAD